jgi:hypothetical protein
VLLLEPRVAENLVGRQHLAHLDLPAAAGKRGEGRGGGD